MKEHTTEQTSFEFEELKTIKGYPELHWTGKRPYTSTQYYPAQLKEVYGQPNEDGWMNKIFWGDNLQVMSHMLKEFRGKIKLIYIDPPFDSKADYKKKIGLMGKTTDSENLFFEQKQYSDIWSNDEYLQFIFERLILLRELLDEEGSIYLHCDYHKSHLLRALMDEVFGIGAADGENSRPGFRNEIIWDKGFRGTESKNIFQRTHDSIFWYTKSSNWIWNQQYEEYSDKKMGRYNKIDENGNRYALIKRVRTDGTVYYGKTYFNEKGKKIEDVIFEPIMASTDSERLGYPTQKPENLIQRLVETSSNPGDLVFDCFMGSGTTLAVALKTGRRFIGADINLGSIQTTTNRLISVMEESIEKVAGFEVYNVNNYELFSNPVEAKDILIDVFNINKFQNAKLFDGEIDGRNVKIMPINRIASRVDLNELIANLPYDLYRKRQEESPNSPVDQITLICMGHEPDLLSEFKKQTSTYKIDIEILDILTDKKDLEFKREAQADVRVVDNRLIIQSFYPMNLLQKLSIQQDTVYDYKQLVESVMIDWNYDGVVLRPSVVDIPEKNVLVEGTYVLPEKTGRIRIKITDLISESLELEVTKNG
jgi:site-specific DNA-methyltransferase (adenine-specific)